MVSLGQVRYQSGEPVFPDPREEVGLSVYICNTTCPSPSTIEGVKTMTEVGQLITGHFKTFDYHII